MWLPLLLWFLAFAPGIMTADSLNVYHQAISGTARWVDWHPPVNMAAMWVSVQLTDGPALVTLAQSLLLAGGMLAVARASMRAGANRIGVVVVTALLAVSPAVGAFSVSVWKDVPFAACVLFIGARVIDLTRALFDHDEAARSRALRSVVGWALVASLVRQNGLVLAALLLAALIVPFPVLRRQAAIGLLVIIATFCGLKALVYPAFGIEGAATRNTFASALHDLGSGVLRDPESLNAGERARAERVAPLDEWRTGYRSYTCNSSDWVLGSQFEWDRNPSSWYIGQWLQVALDHPGMVLGNRLCLSAAAWRPDPVEPQYTVSRATDPNRWGQRVSPVSEPLHDVGVDLIDFTDRPAVKWLFWRAPVWIYVAYAAFAVTAFRRRRWLHLLPVLPVAVQQVTMMVLVLAQDARFMMPALMLAILLLPLSVARHPTPDASGPLADRLEAHTS